ncbi:MAG TPA: MerR family transcriptional regulator [Ramlibacter sp.]|jgi:DNA-binding transcriptional MerR regulator|nr:MerR family transcriptional regulator [Ramlibacter sp.]
MSPQNLQVSLEQGAGAALHRIGSVSRVAGVPVSTLRMWEERYGAFAPAKTEGRHRLYSEEDLVRARLLRQLTESGHSIGGIARLAATELQQMLVQLRSADAQRREPAAPRRLSVVVVGSALAARITSSKWQHLLGDAILEIRRIFRTLDDALLAEGAGLQADVLLVRMTAVQPGADLQLLQVMRQLHARNAVLLYNFAAAPVVGALRERDFLLRREPVEDGELADLLRSMTWAAAPQAPGATQAPRAAIPARRYSDEDLARVATSPTDMLCECPRHIADIIGQLSSFEDYSAKCLNQSEEDAQVHAYLRSVSGSARALFEEALDRVIAHNARAAG